VKALARAGVFPFGVDAVTFRAVWAAVDAMVQLAEIEVAVDELTVQLTPVPDIVTTVAPARSNPFRVTGRFVVPRVPLIGLIEVRVGPVTVKFTVPLVPPGVVIDTVLTLVPADDAIVNVAVT
jgi:hypothetical protein